MPNRCGLICRTDVKRFTTPSFLLLQIPIMPGTPKFSYYLPTERNPVTHTHAVWETPLPLSRKALAGHPEKETGASLHCGDYFNAVRLFLEKNRYESIAAAASRQANRDIPVDDIEEIRICLEKHGEFYHPASVAVKTKEKKLSFVVNVAASPAGTGILQSEFETLQRLNRDFPRSFIPKVYARDEICLPGGDRVLGMFLGEWFEGFYEFHVSGETAVGDRKIVVWDPVSGNFFLSAGQASGPFTQAAMILTYYYNPETTEKISQWHHAAGDFVVKVRDETIESRLVTVRRYEEMFAMDKHDGPSAGSLPEALLIFLVDLSLRMRLDRLDGVGDVVWLADRAVGGVVKGFFEGLRLKVQDGVIPEAFVSYFRGYLSRCTAADLSELSQAVADAHDPRTPDSAVLRENVKAHAAVLHRLIQQI